MANVGNPDESSSESQVDLTWDLPLATGGMQEKNTEPALEGLGRGLHTSADGYRPRTKDTEFNADEQIRDYLGFRDRAEEADKLQRSTSLLTARVTDQLPNGLLPEIKKLVVPKDATLYLFSERHAPIELEPGDHEVSRMGLGGGVDNSFRAFRETAGSGSYAERSGVLICEVRRKLFPFTITLPDKSGFDRVSTLLGLMTDPSAAASRKDNTVELARELGRVFEESRLKTQDGICTGVRVQLDVYVKDPQRLIENYCRSYVKTLQNKYRNLDKELGQRPVDPGLAKTVRFPMRLLWQVVFGARQDGGVPLMPRSLGSVYRRIRLEVADALRDAIRLETARDLIEEPALVRERVSASLEQHVGRSLALFGLAIQRVVSVECVSPEYNRMLVERGRLKLRREKLEDRQTEAEIENEEQRIDSRKFEDQVREQNLRSRHAIREEAETRREAVEEQSKTRQVEDTLRLEVQRRDVQRHQEQAEAHREQRLKNASVDLEIRKKQELIDLEMEERRIALQNQKLEALTGLELRRDEHQHRLEQDALDRAYQREVGKLELLFSQQMQSNEAEMNSRLMFLEKYAGISKGMDEGKLLVMSLASNPRLAKTYVEATRARGKDELIAKMSEFKDQLVAVHGQEDRLVNQLMQEGIRQLGSVLTKHVEKPRTQINTNSVNVAPTDNDT